MIEEGEEEGNQRRQKLGLRKMYRCSLQLLCVFQLQPGGLALLLELGLQGKRS